MPPKEHLVGAKLFVRDFFRKHTFEEDVFSELASRPVRLQHRVLSSLSFAARPVLGSPFPRKWEDMHPTTVPNCLTTVSHAFAWTAAKLAIFSETLGAALMAQVHIESALLLGKFEAAESSLSQFRKDYGNSLWSLDISLLLSQLRMGYHGNRTALSSFLSNSKSDWVNLLSQNSSFRTQLNVSTCEYQASLSFLFPQGLAEGLSAYVTDYFRYRFLGAIPDKDESLCNILHLESRHSCLDQYATFLTLASSKIRMPFDDQTVAALLLLAERIRDPRLLNLACLASFGEMGHATSSPAVLQCIDMHVAGHNAECLEAATRYLINDPTAFLFYDLVASSAAAQPHFEKCPMPFVEGSPSQFLLDALFDWYSARASRGDALESLRRLARALNPTRLGPAIASFVSLFDEQVLPLGSECVSPLGSPVPLPQFSLWLTDPAVGQKYLDGFCRRHGNAAGGDVVAAYLSLCKCPRSMGPHVDLDRPNALRYSAAANYVAGDLHAAVTSLAELRRLAPHVSRCHPELYVIEASALLSLGENEGAVTIIAEILCIDRNLLPPVLLRQAAELLAAPSFTPHSKNIAWPIIAAAAHRSDSTSLSLDRVHDFVDDYIVSSKLTRPSELLNQESSPSRALLVFVKECCTSEILESSIWYNSQEEVIKERLLVCQQLQEASQSPDPDILQEIAELTRRLAILDLTSRIERSRVFIDADTIVKRLDEVTWSNTNSLLSVRALRNKDLQRGLKLLGFPSSDGARPNVIIIDEERSFFDKVFEQIRQQFLYSPELGLDANLSQRIRHGTLAGELRAPFDKYRLSTKRGGNATYEEASYWIEMLDAYGDSERRDLNGAFAAFSASLDDHIRRTREDWIQIRSDTKPDGLFNYAFDDAALQMLVDGISPLAEHAEVHELIIAALWARTENCLSEIRTAIGSRLAPRLEEALDRLGDAVEAVGIAHSLNTVSLRNAVTQCKTEIVRQLERIQDWFHIENRHEQKHFSFRHLVESVEQVLNRINTRCSVDLSDGSHEGLLIPGRFFRPLWDLLVILFDNASRHSGVLGPTISLKTHFASDETSIVCANEMGGDIDMESIGRDVEQLNLLSLSNQRDLNKLRSEGGSGTAKLHKIVRHDLGGGDNDYKIAFEISESDEFEVSISLKSGILDADSNN